MRFGFHKLAIPFACLWIAVLATACGSAPAPPTPASLATATGPVSTPTVSETVEAASTPAVANLQDLSLSGIVAAIAQRTPMPTPVPGPVRVAVERITNEAGLADTRFLGLTVTNWVNLGISILFVVVVVYLGVWLLFGLLRWAVRRTKTLFDDEFLSSFERELKWFLVIVLTRFAVMRLGFISYWLRDQLEDIFFLLTLGVLYIIALHLIAYTAEWYLDHRVPEVKKRQVAPNIEGLKRLVALFVSILFLGSALSHFGLGFTLSVVLMLFFLVIIVVAARAVVDDAISGFILLFDKPFRVGDKIRLVELDIQGEVVEIGLRFSRIRTLDNSEFIVPNSQIGVGLNYCAPDPSLRVHTEIAVGYGVDFEWAEGVIEKAVRSVEGVLPNKPVEIWYLNWGHSNRDMRVLWWIEDFAHELPIRNRVNAAIERAMFEEGVGFNWQTFNLKLEGEQETIDEAAQVVSNEALENERGEEQITDEQ